MFNPRPSGGISHSFSKSSSKLDTTNRGDSQNLSVLDQALPPNLQETNYASTKFRGDYVGLSKRSDDLFRDAKPKPTKNALDFDAGYSQNPNMDSIFGGGKPAEASADGVFEKHHLLRLIFTFERISKMNSRKVISDPLQFHSVDISGYNKDHETFFDKNEKMRKMLYKPNPTKRTFFDNQPRMMKGVRNFGMRGLYREEDMGHESLEGEKSFDVFEMRKMGDQVKYKDSYSTGYGFKDKEYRDMNNDLVRQYSRENSEMVTNFGNTEEQTEMTRPYHREASSNELSKPFQRDTSNADLPRMFSRDASTSELTRQFTNREDSGEMTRHAHREGTTNDLRHLHREGSTTDMNRERSTNDLSRHLSGEASREGFRDSFKGMPAESDQFKNTNFINANNVARAAGLNNVYKDYSQSKELFKDTYDPGSFYKDKEKEKEDGDQSFLERLLDRPFENTENVESEVMSFQQNFGENQRKMWNEFNYQWQYMDPQGMVHGPFSSDQMYHWYLKNFFPQNLRMRYNAKMAWVPFKDLFPANSVPFKSAPKQFATPPTPAATPSLPASNMAAAPSLATAAAALPKTGMMSTMKDGWTQSTTSNLLGASPKSSFSGTDKSSSPSTNLLAPGSLLSGGASTSLLGTSAPSSLLGSTATNTNLLAPGNLLGANSLLNPSPSTTSLLGSSTTSSSLLRPTQSAGVNSGLLGQSAPTSSLLGPSPNPSTASLLNNRLDNIWNTTQSTVHPISSMSNLNLGVQNMTLGGFQQMSANHLNKRMPSSGSLSQSSVPLNKQMSGHTHVSPREAVAQQPAPPQMPRQFSGSPPADRPKPAPLPTAVAPPVQPAATATNERKWNAPQVEVSSLLEIMELEKKCAQERVVKSPPKPVQTGWNLSNVGTNNLSESDDFPSLSTVTTPNPAAPASSATAAKKFGKHITMPLETFIEKHPLTSPPQLTESFSSKLLGNKH